MISFGMKDILFQQDKAPVHKANGVMAWFERNCIEIEETPLIPPIWILLSMHGLSLKSDYTSSIQGLEIPQKERRQ